MEGFNGFLLGFNELFMSDLEAIPGLQKGFCFGSRDCHWLHGKGEKMASLLFRQIVHHQDVQGVLVLRRPVEDLGEDTLYFLEFYKDSLEPGQPDPVLAAEPDEAWLLPATAPLSYINGKLRVDLSDDDDSIQVEFETQNARIVDDIRLGMTVSKGSAVSVIEAIQNYCQPQPVAARKPQHSLSEVLSKPLLQSLTDDPEAVAELKSFLPHGYTDEMHVAKILRSPQLRATVRKLSAVIYSEELPGLFSALGLPLSLADKDGVLYSDATKAFLDALENQTGTESTS
eukprot:Protomagalhaensia_sp_Gyna_25__5644@NODE_793_length_2604_cov_46_670175_g624_i0_p2_GENE_NODE_793_length_2604_cov_46_670175_g624_i0NODE_793_length_2604_cov_46_670175_g624_i0_p2_ORF_typecomplete_len286_score46_13RPN13_C/PF16550_5/7_9e16_NODE_793_length_2604_cov_46_670175_g624_i03961253